MDTSPRPDPKNFLLQRAPGLPAVGSLPDYEMEVPVGPEAVEAENASLKAYLQARDQQRENVGKRHLRGALGVSAKTISDFVQYRINYDTPSDHDPTDRAISFHLRPWQLAIYDSEYVTKVTHPALGGGSNRFKPKSYLRRKTLVMSGRQCEKSTGEGNKLLALVTLLRNINALYVTSAGLNMREFVDERIDNVVRISPKLREAMGPLVVSSLYAKRLERNNSRITLRAAHLNADRVRGIPADVLAIDEIQNFLMRNLPVITATLNNSDMEYGPITLMAGTPLTFDNPIHQIWSKNSTQNCWGMRCSGCRRMNFPPTNPNEVLRMIGPRGLVCFDCGKALDPFGGQWIQLGPSDSPYEGFHLSRCLMPYTAIATPERFRAKWLALFQDTHDPTVDEATKMNEIFGVSWDSGKKPITMQELQQICHPGIHAIYPSLPREVITDSLWPKFAGIDWGEGSGRGGYTVLTMGFVNHHPELGEVVQVSYMRRFMGAEADPRYLWGELSRILTENRITACFCDAGFGWGMIDGVRDRIDDGMQRLIPLSYRGQSVIMGYDDMAHQFTCDRTRWMAKIFNLLKTRKVLLPSWEVMGKPVGPFQGFAQDILTIYADRSPKRHKMQYNHSEPDDAFHALLYLLTAKLWYYRELEFFANA